MRSHEASDGGDAVAISHQLAVAATIGALSGMERIIGRTGGRENRSQGFAEVQRQPDPLTRRRVAVSGRVANEEQTVAGRALWPLVEPTGGSGRSLELVRCQLGKGGGRLGCVRPREVTDF